MMFVSALFFFFARIISYTLPSMGFVFFLRMNPRGTGSLSEIRTTHFMLVAV